MGLGGQRGPPLACTHPASVLSRSLGSVLGAAAWALPADAGGAGSRCQEVQHEGGGLPALPRRRLRVSLGGFVPLGLPRPQSLLCCVLMDAVL